MTTDIDYYFDGGKWIFPEYIFLNNGKNATKVKNSELRIKADFLDPTTVRYYTPGYQFWNTLGVVVGKSLFRIKIDTTNLLRVIQYSGISEDGFLKGTYKLQTIPYKINPAYKLIPEDTRENYIKTEFSKIYHNKKNGFSYKLIPGHLYASKSGELFICLSNKVRSYGSSYYYLSYNKTPIEQKILLYFDISLKDELDKLLPKTFEDFFDKIVVSRRPRFISYKYSGKDLGKIVDPDEILKLIIKPKNLPKLETNLLLINELWRTNSDVKKELIRRVNQSSYSFPGRSFLENELGI